MVCSTIHKESSRVIYASNTFKFVDRYPWIDMLVFCSKISKPNRDILRQIGIGFAEESMICEEFRDIGCIQAEQMMKIAMKCISVFPALKTLTMLSGWVITSALVDTFD